MKRRRIWFVIGLLGSAGLVVFLLWPSKPTPFGLKIVRQSREQGKAVVYFRVEGGKPKMLINRIVKVVDGAERDPVNMDNFYSFSKAWPLGEPGLARKEFGIFPPTNSVWKLRVSIVFEGPNEPSRIQRIKDFPTMWRAARAAGSSFTKALWYTWNAFDGRDSQVIESDRITNAIPVAKAP